MRYTPILCLLAVLALAACSREYEPTQEITDVRDATPEEIGVPELDTAERLRMKAAVADAHAAVAESQAEAPAQAPAAPAPSGTPVATQAAMPSPTEYRWNIPQGWVELPPTSMRLANFHVEGHPEAEVYFGALPGDGGGLAANVNRWRRQMGLESLDEAVIASLPIKPLLLKDATFVLLEGTFTGMGADPAPDYMMFGLMLIDQGSAYYVKMVGPKDVVADQLPNFQMFSQSIVPTNAEFQQGEYKLITTPTGSEDPPIQAIPMVETNEPQAAEPEPAESHADAGPFNASSMHWHAPDGWEEQGPRPMRAVTYQIGENVECYISVLSGTAGGVAGNLNRWRSQMGQEALSDEAIADLETLDIAGVASPYLEINGDYTGMRGPTFPDYTMLGVMRPSEDQSVFIKMVGPADEVRDEVESFQDFCRSIH